MEFKKYNKIYWLFDGDWNPRSETDGILEGVCHVQEKIDGANLSVWLGSNGEIRVGSRNQDVSEWSFRWAVEYIRGHEGIISFLKDNPTFRLYWEWLVPHTITNYHPDAYKHFYLFDIEKWDEFIPIWDVYDIAFKYKIKTPEYHWIFTNPTIEELNKLVGKSAIGPFGEWIVIKNPSFINTWGDKCYAKIVWEKFKEDNGVMFGNHQKGDNEMKIVNKFVTEWRIRKIINKIEQNEDRDVDKKDVAKIIWTTYNDILEEEFKWISQQWIINFKRLKSLATKRIAMIAVWIINWEPVSVALEEK